MTDTIQWGPPILVDGKRPDWLTNDFSNRIQWQPVEEWREVKLWRGWCAISWANVPAIRLAADHPASICQAYNDKHGTDFYPWMGGYHAPDDWDEEPVLFRRGDLSGKGAGTRLKLAWWYSGSGTDIVGYARRPATVQMDGAITQDTVTIRRMTSVEAREWAVKHSNTATHADALERALKLLGIVKDKPTRAERIAADIGLSVADVERVLERVKEAEA